MQSFTSAFPHLEALRFLDFIFFHSCVYNNSLIIRYGGVCAQLCPTLCDPWIPRPWNFPGKNTGVGCHFLLQGSFPAEGLNPLLPCLLHSQGGSLLQSHLRSPSQVIQSYKNQLRSVTRWLSRFFPVSRWVWVSVCKSGGEVPRCLRAREAACQCRGQERPASAARETPGEGSSDPLQHLGLPGSSAGKESDCRAGGPSLIPGSKRCPEEGIGYHSSILGLSQGVSSVQFSSGVSDSLWPHGPQDTRPPCPSPTPGDCSNSCPLSQWCHPTISSSVVPFSSCLPSFPASGFFPVSQFFASGGQSIGASASASVLPVHIQDWFPIGLAPMAQSVKNPPVMGKTLVLSLGWEDPLEEGMTTHSSIFAWKIPMDRGAW